MDQLAIQRYIKDALGLHIALSAWEGRSRLPFYLQDRYEFAATTLLGTSCLLVIAQEIHRTDGVRRDLEALQKQLPTATLPIYVAERLASYERRRLIEQGVPFLVPGNQLYVPDLAVDLREHFLKRRSTTAAAFSPAAQALLVVALLQPWRDSIHPAALAQQLHYSPITISRVANEWLASGLVETFNVGRERWVRFPKGPRETWLQSQAQLRTPVRATHWAIGHAKELDGAPLAGISALAELSPLASPTTPTRALSSDQWKQALKSGLQPVPSPDSGATQVEVWRYGPIVEASRKTVDPLSLILSLRDQTDERVLQAIEHLEGALPW